MNPPLPVTRPAFDEALERLIANFDPYLDVERLTTLENEYHRVFTFFGATPENRDDLLKLTVDRLIDFRQERGMPRVAEFRQVLDAVRDADAYYRSTDRVLGEIDRLTREAEERRRG